MCRSGFVRACFPAGKNIPDESIINDSVPGPGIDLAKELLYPYAIAAVKRTAHEYATVAEVLSELGLARFRDTP